MSSDIKRNTEKYPHIMRSGRIPTILAHSILKKNMDLGIMQLMKFLIGNAVEMKYFIAEAKRFKDENGRIPEKEI